MGFRAILYAYILGGFTFIPFLLLSLVAYTIYTSVPIDENEIAERKKRTRPEVDQRDDVRSAEALDAPKPRKGWLTVRHTFEESPFDGGYVTLVRTFLDARSKDPKRSRPKDMWYVVLKGKILYLYEDEEMTECEGVIELGSYDVTIYPSGMLDGELFTKRNAIQLKPKALDTKHMPNLTRDMKYEDQDLEAKLDELQVSEKQKSKMREQLSEEQKKRAVAREEGPENVWFIFVRSVVEMEDWYFSLVHASDHPPNTPILEPFREVFLPSDMNLLVSALDDQPDVIPMRWFNALFGRLFYSFYRTDMLESFIIGRLMKKLSKVKRPAFLTEICVTEVSVGNRTPTFSKPMLKELTKEGDASMEVHIHFKGEIRITVEATAIINLGARFKSYTVKLVLAAVLKELEGNIQIKIKRPPSSRIWYAFTQMPRMVMSVEPIVSDRQITWSMILSTIEARLKEIIQESVVLPNMDDIAFFDSERYEHRGGIWSDATRRAKEPRVVAEDTSSTISEPPTIVPPAESGPSQRSQSMLETSIRPSASKSDTSETVTLSVEGPNRRRTWQAEETDNDVPPSAEERGRSMDVEEKTHNQRSHSTPQVSAESDEQSSTDEGPLSPSLSRSQPSSRRSSQHLPASGHALSQSFDDRSFKMFGESATSPSKNARATLAENTASFLSTLKSRAAATDKQTLSNSAKEAMRKWGVNWGSMRKDSDAGDIPDQDGINQRSGRSETDSGSISRARASYAEVRAAVEERKEKTRKGQFEELPASEGSAPIDIGNGNSRGGSSRSSSVNGSWRDPSPASGSGEEGPSSSELPARARTMDPFISQNEENVGPAFSPIHVQPQAKTMSIPGIHAKHRGEVMSMGYVAPPQAGPSTADNRLKNPVYRLWKGPATTQTLELAADSSTTTAMNAEENEVRDPPAMLSPNQNPKTPPPLPPRRTPTSATLPLLERQSSTNSSSSGSIRNGETTDQGLT